MNKIKLISVLTLALTLLASTVNGNPNKQIKPPATPTNLEASCFGDSVIVDWTDNVEYKNNIKDAGFILIRGILADDGFIDWTLVNVLGAKSTMYFDCFAIHGKTNLYLIWSFDKYGISDLSNVCEVFVP